MRRVSLNMRQALDGHTTDEVEVCLLQFEHPLLTAPLRLSTDPTERISSDPLVYGTRSTWLGADPATEPFLFVLASAQLPGDGEDGAQPATIVLENIDAGIAEILRSFTDRAICHVAVVLAGTPDVIEAEVRDLRLLEHGGDAQEIALQLSRLPIEEEGVPMDRFTKERFPGLFR